ncbi:MAG: flagellar assembly protein FliX [Devosia sp.]
MRIDNNSRVGSIGARPSAGRVQSGGPFEVGQGVQATQSRAATAISAPASLDALLALQAVEDPLLKKRRAARRGSQLLDTLDGLKTDLLAGKMSEGRLNQLMAVMSQAREQSDPGLDALLDDIELRARVELAKRGLFPA